MSFSLKVWSHYSLANILSHIWACQATSTTHPIADEVQRVAKYNNTT